MKSKFIILLFLFISGTLFASAQAVAKFSYAAQKQFIPAELGRVYLGMPFREFAKNFDFKQSEADDRFGWLEVKVPFNRGNVRSLFFKVHGLSAEEMANLIRLEKITENKGTADEYEREVKRLDASKIPAKGFVYEISLEFKENFDLKKYALSKFGKPADGGGNAQGIYDMQWTKKTPDRLVMLIRSHENTRVLQLIGVIDKTEWDPKA